MCTHVYACVCNNVTYSALTHPTVHLHAHTTQITSTQPANIFYHVPPSSLTYSVYTLTHKYSLSPHTNSFSPHEHTRALTLALALTQALTQALTLTLALTLTQARAHRPRSLWFCPPEAASCWRRGGGCRRSLGHRCPS